MRRLAFLALLATVGLSAAGPAVGQAQEPARRLRLDVTAPGNPPVAVPLPDAKALEQEVEKAIRETQARGRTEAQIREVLDRLRGAPHHTYDIVNGIQSLRVHDALRHR